MTASPSEKREQVSRTTALKRESSWGESISEGAPPGYDPKGPGYSSGCPGVGKVEKKEGAIRTRRDLRLARRKKKPALVGAREKKSRTCHWLGPRNTVFGPAGQWGRPRPAMSRGDASAEKERC